MNATNSSVAGWNISATKGVDTVASGGLKNASYVMFRNSKLKGFDQGFKEALAGSRILLGSLFVCYLLQLLAGAAKTEVWRFPLFDVEIRKGKWGFPVVPWLTRKIGFVKSVDSDRCWSFVEEASWSASMFFVVLLNFRAFVGLVF